MEMISLFCYLFMLWKIIGMNIKLVILFLATQGWYELFHIMYYLLLAQYITLNNWIFMPSRKEEWGANLLLPSHQLNLLRMLWYASI